MQTNGVSARYGLHPYAVVNAITKSGTNQIHGSLFEFVRNGAFNARNFFAPTQDSLRRNQFGGTVGGPIRKDKIFLFNGFQATRTRTAPPQSISFVPTAGGARRRFQHGGIGRLPVERKRVCSWSTRPTISRSRTTSSARRVSARRR